MVQKGFEGVEKRLNELTREVRGIRMELLKDHRTRITALEKEVKYIKEQFLLK